MSHFAQVKDGIVQQVICAEQDFINTLSDASSWIQTSYNTHGNQHSGNGTPLRGNFAGIGYTYDTTHDVFYTPQPYPSWSLNTTSWLWTAPTPMPSDGNIYKWDEATLAWIQIQ
jgi:hypothetical protein